MKGWTIIDECTVPPTIPGPFPGTITDLGHGGAEATFSADRVYRYSLKRLWQNGAPRHCWVMLNPSTADALKLDPTIRRCVNFSKAWGAGSIEIVNAYALRSTDPRAIKDRVDPFGRLNHVFIRSASARAERTIVAWGTHVEDAAYWRDHRESTCTKDLVSLLKAPVFCLGKTKDGHPKHPLYVPASTELQEFQ